MTPAPRQFRCAIYTRVSTDHGLEQEFNSLDNQREAAQAYVKSQAHEGWRPVRDRYDDGGFSGGSMERPGLRRLLDAIQARRVDIVVVYKVDRLTRSLADFAKLVELFDQHGVSFVSGTQSFNTTTSMGRLTLNVLLSFAQFEREVTGERIRDKIAASKRKGIWVGGVVPFGYGLAARKLVVDPNEAPIVRRIFERYLVLGSLRTLQQELRNQGIVTRQRPQSSGKTRGGVPLTNGPLQHMLRNRTYIGELNHRGRSYPADHQALVETTLFEAVQAKLDAQRNAHSTRRIASQAMLMGLLFDDRGHRMCPAQAVRSGLRYRYYVSAMVMQGRKAEAGSVPRVAASEIEQVVTQALHPFAAIQDGETVVIDRDRLTHMIERITIWSDRIVIVFSAEDGSDASRLPLEIAWSRATQVRRRDVIRASDTNAAARPIRAESRATLLMAIARARRWLAEIMSGAIADLGALALREKLTDRSVRMALSLAFVAPDIVEAAVDGTLSRGFNLSRLTDLPTSWEEQRRVLGLRHAP